MSLARSFEEAARSPRRSCEQAGFAPLLAEGLWPEGSNAAERGGGKNW
jgi:hypothetical protein